MRAIRSKFAVMDVVQLMTVRAVTTQLRMGSQWSAMAGLAGNLRMRPVQDKARLQVVVEEPLLPVNRVVACRTVRAETAFVRVVRRMAVHALLRSIAEHVRFMAVAAVDIRVFAKEWEARQVVVEEHAFLPRRFVVTVVTPDAERLRMRIVVFVAAEAVGLQSNVEDRRDVAGGTLSVGMSAVQGMTGIDRVIELHGRPA